MPHTDDHASARRFRARSGDYAFDVVVTPGAHQLALTLDDRTVAAVFDPVDAHRFALALDSRNVPVIVEPLPDGRLRVTVDGRTIDVAVQDEKDLLLERFGIAAGAAGGLREVRAPMPGLVLSVSVAPGQPVEAGAGLLVLEAMKMENELKADAAGVVKSIHVAPGDAVSKNTLLIEFEA